MIRSLRRRHRWMWPALLLLLVAAAALAIGRRATPPSMNVLPSPLVEQGTASGR